MSTPASSARAPIQVDGLIADLPELILDLVVHQFGRVGDVLDDEQDVQGRARLASQADGLLDGPVAGLAAVRGQQDAVVHALRLPRRLQRPSGTPGALRSISESGIRRHGPRDGFSIDRQERRVAVARGARTPDTYEFGPYP
jgi:hypothetical protein